MATCDRESCSGSTNASTSSSVRIFGCTFSAAIAARLALGVDLAEAVRGAKGYLTEAIRRSYSVGHGHGPVDHLYPLTAR